MTIPKELSLPPRDFEEMLGHLEEYSAHELVQSFKGKAIQVRNEGRLQLPYDSVTANGPIPVAPLLELPAGSRTLSGLVNTPYEKISDHQRLYSQFGMQINYVPETHMFIVRLEKMIVRISMEQTYVNYSHTGYQDMIFGVLACFSSDNDRIVDQMRRNGVLITTSDRSSETSLLVPGKIMRSQAIPRLPWQSKYEKGALYPLDIDTETYKPLDHQNRPDVRERVKTLLAIIHPVGVRVQSDSVEDVFIQKRPI